VPTRRGIDRRISEDQLEKNPSGFFDCESRRAWWLFSSPILRIGLPQERQTSSCSSGSGKNPENFSGSDHSRPENFFKKNPKHINPIPSQYGEGRL
jgi:hypothetical protein